MQQCSLAYFQCIFQLFFVCLDLKCNYHWILRQSCTGQNWSYHPRFKAVAHLKRKSMQKVFITFCVNILIAVEIIFYFKLFLPYPNIPACITAAFLASQQSVSASLNIDSWIPFLQTNVLSKIFGRDTFKISEIFSFEAFNDRLGRYYEFIFYCKLFWLVF